MVAESNVFWGELASLGAALCWAIGLCILSHFGKEISARGLNLYKCLVASAFLTTVLLIRQPNWPQEPHLWVELALSGIVGIALGDTALFAAMGLAGTQVASAGLCLAAPLTALVALFTLGEALTSFEWLGLFLTVLAVAGVFYFNRDPQAFSEAQARKGWLLGVFFAVLSPLGHAVGVVLGRHAMDQIDVFVGTLLRIGASAIVLLLLNQWQRNPLNLRAIFKTPRVAMALTTASFIGSGLGLVCMTVGMKYTKAGVTASLTSTFPIWVIPLAGIFLGERVTWAGVFCTLLAVVGVAFLF